MRRQGFRCGALTWVSALFVLAAVAGAPRPAVADCTHSLAPRDPHALSSQLELLDRLDSPAPDAAPQSNVPPVLPRPCSGPQCSKAPALPVPAPAPAASVPLRVDSWACLTLGCTPTADQGKLFPRRHEPARPQLTGPSIERPPRLRIIDLS